MEELQSSAVAVLEERMRFHRARQAVLAANLANVDTPGYRRVELRFESALDGARLRATRPGHVGHEAPRHRLETAPRSRQPDGNGVELEREVIAMSRNAGAFTDQAAVLSRLLALTRVAVTGEAR